MAYSLIKADNLVLKGYLLRLVYSNAAAYQAETKWVSGGPGEVRTLDLMTARNPATFHTFHPFPCFPWLYTNSGHLLSLKRRSPLVSISSTFGTLLEHPAATEWKTDFEA